MNGFKTAAGAPAEASRPLDVAVVGGGIVGVMTALGLLKRGMRVIIYERAADWTEVGFGFGFTAVARECMERLDPRILQALLRIGWRDSNAMVRYWDGFHPRTKETAEDPAASLMFEMPEKDLALVACLRTRFQLEIAKLISATGGEVHFGKQVVNLTDEQSGQDNNKVLLSFADGTTAEADVVIGCDGVHSTTRKWLLGADHPASKARYSHKAVYRGLVPRDGVVAALGESKANTLSWHLGPDASVVVIPIPINKTCVIDAFFHDKDDWPKDNKTSTAPATREDVQERLKDWGPHVRELAALLPDNLSRWGIFDLYEHPAPTFAAGRVCIAGDSAHATCPFHGAGASISAEDAVVLAELLGAVGESPVEGRARKIAAALQTYSAVRKERDQWLVQSSRDVGDMLQFQRSDLAPGLDNDRVKTDLDGRVRKIWDFDVDKMLADAKKGYEKLTT